MGTPKTTERKRNPNSLANLEKGHGRPRGVRNKVSYEAKLLCNRIVNDRRYLAALKKRMIAGDAGAMEPIVWYYAKGKPTEHIALSSFDPLKYLARDDEASSE